MNPPYLFLSPFPSLLSCPSLFLFLHYLFLSLLLSIFSLFCSASLSIFLYFSHCLYLFVLSLFLFISLFLLLWFSLFLLPVFLSTQESLISLLFWSFLNFIQKQKFNLCLFRETFLSFFCIQNLYYSFYSDFAPHTLLQVTLSCTGATFWRVYISSLEAALRS